MSAKTASGLTVYRRSKSVVRSLVARQTWHGAVLWAVIFSVFTASKAVGYAAAYPNVSSRELIIHTLGNNVGLNALFGKPYDLETVAGFTVWNCLGVMAIVGAVWGILAVTKTFRGEEAAGRWEMLLTGQTTARRAAVNALLGMGRSLVLFYVLLALCFVAVGAIHTVQFNALAAAFFALAVVASVAQFAAIGALMSQIMPTRSRAAGSTAAFFGMCFFLRAMGNTTSADWLRNISPLGWIDNLHPLHNPNGWWLIPIACVTMAASALTIFLAGRRDLGDSVLPDKETAKPHLAFLRSPLLAAIRLTRVSSLTWIFAVTLMSLLFGLLTKAATQLFNDSANASQVIHRISHAQDTLGPLTFLGVTFFILMVIIMSYAASAIGAVREDEAEGYLDNLLVQPISRSRWLLGRIGLIIVVIALAGSFTSLGSWAGTSLQQLHLPFHNLWVAGVNAMAPAVLTLGVAVFGFGFAPRFALIGSYGVIAWSFLVQMVSSGINLNHWILDTSVLHHIALAPATEPNWHAAGIVAGLGVVFGFLGILRFHRRDLQTE